MNGLDLGTLGTASAALLVAVATFIGVIVKRSTDRQAARDAAAKAIADRESEERKAAAKLEAEQRQAAYDQMQENLEAAWGQVRALQDDLGRARTDMGTLWSQMATMRREFEAAESHIADIHRWDEAGRVGPIPPRKVAL